MRTIFAVLLSVLVTGCNCGTTCPKDNINCQVDGLEVYESDESGALKRKLDLTEIDVANTVNIWAGGTSGAILKYTGDGWRAQTQIAATKPMVWGLWGSAPSDMWASQGNGTLLHDTGEGWKSFAVPTDAGLLDVHGTNADDVWVVGERGTILHVAGGAATKVASPATASLFAVWANSPTDAWAAGSGGAMYRYNGTSWTATTSPAADHIWEIWGTAANNLYAVSDNNGVPNRGNLYRYDGTSWTLVSLGTGVLGLRSVFGVSSTDIWAVGVGGTAFHYDGTAWKKVSTSTTDMIFSLWGPTGNNLFFGLASSDAFIRHYDGAKFNPSFAEQGTARKMFGLGCCKDHANLEKPTLKVDALPNPLHFDAKKESAPIQLGWTDPYPCRPAICFMVCPKGMRCSTRARCTQGVRDNLSVGQAWFSVKPWKAEPAESQLFDLGIFPISGKNCPPDLTGLKDAPQDVAVGPPVLVPTQVTADEPGGTGGGTGSEKFVEGTITAVQCRFVNAGIAGFNIYEISGSGTARASTNAGVFFARQANADSLGLAAETCDGWNTLNSGCNRGGSEKTDISWTLRQGEEFQGSRTFDVVLTGALPGGQGSPELARESVTCAPP